MYLHPAIYDLDELCRENLHIHTSFSPCARAEMTVAAIIAKAESCGLERIALTDHAGIVRDRPLMRHLTQTRRQIEKIRPAIEVLCGAELSAYAPGRTGESEKIRQALDYRLYAANHYHDFWEFPADRSPAGFALHMVEMVRSLILSGRADCIAHPLNAGYLPFADKPAVTRHISDRQLGELMELSLQYETAWELSTGSVNADPAFHRRMWHIGKETGAVFNLGSDAHRLHNIDTELARETLHRHLD